MRFSHNAPYIFFFTIYQIFNKITEIFSFSSHYLPHLVDRPSCAAQHVRKHRSRGNTKHRSRALSNWRVGVLPSPPGGTPTSSNEARQRGPQAFELGPTPLHRRWIHSPVTRTPPQDWSAARSSTAHSQVSAQLVSTRKSLVLTRRRISAVQVR